jgi:hypothetical protein
MQCVKAIDHLGKARAPSERSVTIERATIDGGMQ